jgi:HPt (histidine-containing phosphotransfer) domain-containing protein
MIPLIEHSLAGETDSCRIMKKPMNLYKEQIKDYLVNQFNLPPEQIETMLPGLITTLADHIDNLEVALEQGDLEQLGKAGHTIKGALLNLGIEECADIAYSIEMNGKTGNDDINYQQLVKSIREKLDCYIN